MSGVVTVKNIGNIYDSRKSTISEKNPDFLGSADALFQ